jgi:trehalose 6-phosphate synthase/phosphatase
MSRLLIISNRLPVHITRQKDRLQFQPSVGGLATGLASYRKASQSVWIGWPGLDCDTLNDTEKKDIRKRLNAMDCVPVHLTAKEMRYFYEGFCNKTIWPLFHYFQLYTIYEQAFWQAYQQVNERFLEITLKIAKPGDTIWVHDYQLMLLPELLRHRLPEASIGFFLHIPFPSFEVFRLLPWRREIINGMLGANLVGFHTYDYARHFLSCVRRLTGYENTLGRIQKEQQLVKVDAFPMGIDYDRYANAVQTLAVNKYLTDFRKKTHHRRIILSVDRLDYTKGILQRLEAYDLFLTEHPQYAEKVILILLTVPSRTGVEHYELLRNQLDGLVGRINGKHGCMGWVPVWYMYRDMSFDRLSALYAISDIGLITPLRDGMNLIAKEFIAAHHGKKGVLILSEMAGAASELPEALIVNANDKHAISKAIHEAIDMPEHEQIRRNHLMQNRLSRYTVHLWAHDFLEGLKTACHLQESIRSHKFSKPVRRTLIQRYQAASNRLLLLDYDGTLSPFASRPEQARPNESLLGLLKKLTSKRSNTIVIISGRDRHTLQDWLGSLHVCLVAEHGAWYREKTGQWECMTTSAVEWKKQIRPILDFFTDRTPGSEVEEKDYSLVWHHRRADMELAQVRSQEIKDALRQLTANLDLGVFDGNKILEVKNVGIHKGAAATNWINRKKWPFILAAGDDYTDEDMFTSLPEKAFSIKIGVGRTQARFTMESSMEFLELLSLLTDK